MPDNVSNEIVELWLNGSGHREIGRQMNLPKSTVTVTNIVNSETPITGMEDVKPERQEMIMS